MSTQNPSDNEQTAIIVGADYRLTKDSMQWIVEKRSVPKGPRATREERWSLVGYFPKLDQACHALLEQKLRDSDATEIKSLIWLIAEAKQEITEELRRR